MKKKTLKSINDIIVDMTELEVIIARHAHFNDVASKKTQLEWFQTLQKITSRLDEVYRGEETSS